MGWKEFLRPDKLKILVFAIIIIVIFGLQYVVGSFQGILTEVGQSMSSSIGLPAFYTKTVTCTSVAEYCTDFDIVYDFNWIFLVANLVILYLVSCLVVSFHKAKK